MTERSDEKLRARPEDIRELWRACALLATTFALLIAYSLDA